MKISMLVMAISLLAVLASCSNESPIEVQQKEVQQQQEVQKGETMVFILAGIPDQDDDDLVIGDSID